MPQPSPRLVALSCSASNSAFRCARYSFRFALATRGRDGRWSLTVNPCICCFVDSDAVLSSRQPNFACKDAVGSGAPRANAAVRMTHRPPSTTLPHNIILSAHNGPVLLVPTLAVAATMNRRFAWLATVVYRDHLLLEFLNLAAKRKNETKDLTTVVVGYATTVTAPHTTGTTAQTHAHSTKHLSP